MNRVRYMHQQDLFLQNRIPKKPYCTDDLHAGIRPRSYLHAIKHRYIQVNPPHLRVFMLFDIDREGGALAWEDNGYLCLHGRLSTVKTVMHTLPML